LEKILLLRPLVLGDDYRIRAQFFSADNPRENTDPIPLLDAAITLQDPRSDQPS
jgi:hypothetical protein